MPKQDIHKMKVLLTEINRLSSEHVKNIQDDNRIDPQEILGLADNVLRLYTFLEDRENLLEIIEEGKDIDREEAKVIANLIIDIGYDFKIIIKFHAGSKVLGFVKNIFGKFSGK